MEFVLFVSLLLLLLLLLYSPLLNLDRYSVTLSYKQSVELFRRGSASLKATTYTQENMRV
jgi:hypothetical protein